TLDHIYIYEKSDIDKFKEKIIEKCIEENARVYFDLTSRSLKKVAMKSMVLTSQLIFNEEYKSAKNVYNKAFGNTPGKKKYFLIDYDNNDQYTANDILNYLENDGIIIDHYPTLNGCHIITIP